MRRGAISDEQRRILRAASAGLLAVNEHHRYVIAGESRPARQDRERLFKRGFLAWGSGVPFITEAGRQVLASKDGK